MAMRWAWTRCALFVLCAIGALAFSRVPLGAAELVMFHQAACEWCERWHEEVGVVYSKTPAARKAPLRLIDIHDDRPADLKGLKPVVYTPTFVLAENGREIGRILGYMGEDFFWSYLERLLTRVTPASTACLADTEQCRSRRSEHDQRATR